MRVYLAHTATSSNALNSSTSVSHAPISAIAACTNSSEQIFRTICSPTTSLNPTANLPSVANHDHLLSNNEPINIQLDETPAVINTGERDKLLNEYALYSLMVKELSLCDREDQSSRPNINEHRRRIENKSENTFKKNNHGLVITPCHSPTDIKFNALIQNHLSAIHLSAIHQGGIMPNGNADAYSYLQHLTAQANLNQDFVTTNGKPDMSAYFLHKKKQLAILNSYANQSSPDVKTKFKYQMTQCPQHKGFITRNDRPDTEAHANYLKQQDAIRKGYAKPDMTAYTSFSRSRQDGSPDTRVYKLNQHQRSALRQGFINLDGSPDTAAFHKNQREKAAIKAGFIMQDSRPDMPAYYLNIKQKAALRAGLVKPDGSPDLYTLNKLRKKQTLLRKVLRGQHQ